MLRYGLLVAVLLGASVSATSAEEIRKSYHETFPAHEGTRLDLRHGDGDVMVQVWDKNEIRVDVEYHATVQAVGAGQKGEFSVEFETDGDTIHVIDKEGDVRFVGVYLNVRTVTHRYDVHMPAYVQLATRGGDGDVEIEGVSGDLTCDLGDGDMVLRDISSPHVNVELDDGDLEANGLTGHIDFHLQDGHVRMAKATGPGGRIELSDGTLRMTHCTGDYEIAADDGDIHLIAHRGRKLHVTIVDGDADLELLPVDDLDVDVQANDGNVDLLLARGTSASFLFTTNDGSVRVSHPELSKFEESDRGAYGEIGDGKGKIRVRCEDGRVTLHES